MTQIYRFCFLSFCSSLIYLLSMIGNLTIITLTFIDSHLKIPMYFFLRNFFILEVFYHCLYSQIPVYLASGDNTVTYNLCATQLFFLIVLGVTEFFLLTAMSYDHYVATCKPLHYTIIMNNMVCIKFLIPDCSNHHHPTIWQGL